MLSLLKRRFGLRAGIYETMLKIPEASQQAYELCRAKALEPNAPQETWNNAYDAAKKYDEAAVPALADKLSKTVVFELLPRIIFLEIIALLLLASFGKNFLTLSPNVTMLFFSLPVLLCGVVTCNSKKITELLMVRETEKVLHEASERNIDIALETTPMAIESTSSLIYQLINAENSHNEAEKLRQQNIISYEDIPNHYKCSISGQVMTDPVLIGNLTHSRDQIDSHVYERTEILKHIDKYDGAHPNNLRETISKPQLVRDFKRKVQISVFFENKKNKNNEHQLTTPSNVLGDIGSSDYRFSNI